MTSSMRRTAAAFAGVLLAAAPLSGCDIRIGSAAAGLTEHVQKTFAVTGTPDVTLTTFDGAVEIRAWDRSEVFVDVEKRAGDRAGLDAIDVVASQDGNRITLEARHPPRKDILTIGVVVSPSARIVASVPRTLNLAVSSGDGSITIERVHGRLDLKTDDGTVHGRAVGGELLARTNDGSMQFDDFDGRAEVESGDGGVRLTGRLDLLRVRTGDGSVRVRVDEGAAMAGDWEIRTSDGSVTLELPEPFDAELDASTGDGRVVVDGLALDASSEDNRRSIRGTLGSGGPLLRLRTGDGTIRISRQ